jgi:branched-chain amino acid transport system substrate-binding protein
MVMKVGSVKTALKLGLVSSLSISMLTMGGCAGSAALGGDRPQGDADQVIIGSLHPRTGSNAADGQQMDFAAKMAIEEINDDGGIDSLNGAELELSSVDTKSEPETAQSEATRLIQEGSSALIGAFESGPSANISSVAERNEVPFVMDVAALDSILEQGYDYSFRIQPSGSMMGKRSADYLDQMAKDAGEDVSRVGVLYEQGNYGTAVDKAFEARIDDLGMNVSTSISYDPASSNMSTQVQRAVAGGVDVLAVTGYYSDSLLISQAINSISPDIKAVFGVANGGFDQEQFVKDAPNGGDGYLNANYRLDVTNKDSLRVASKFERSYGEPMRASAALTYDAVKLVAEAINEAGSADPSAIREAIADSDYRPIVVNDGTVKFDATGQNVNATVSVLQVQKGQIRTVFPDDLAESPYEFPSAVNSSTK